MEKVSDHIRALFFMIYALRNYPYRFIAECKLRINTADSVVLFKP